MVSVTQITSDIGLVSSLFSGPLVKLGTFAFADFEIPERVQWGGKQQLVTHKYPGGARTIDAMGQDDDDISWSGIFLGSNAVSRAQQLDRIRIAGQPVKLTWGSISKTVLVASVSYVQRYSRVEYSITCVPTQVPLPATLTQGLLGSLTNDLGNALGINIPATMATVQNSLAQVQPVLNVAGALTGGSPAALGILGAVNNAQNITAQVSGAANGVLGAFSSGASAFSAGNPGGATSLIGSLGNAVQQASAAAGITPFLNRMASNLKNPGAA